MIRLLFLSFLTLFLFPLSQLLTIEILIHSFLLLHGDFLLAYLLIYLLCQQCIFELCSILPDFNMTMYFFDVYTTNEARKTQSIQLAWGSDLSGLSISAFFVLEVLFLQYWSHCSYSIESEGNGTGKFKRDKRNKFLFYCTKSRGWTRNCNMFIIFFAKGTYNIPTNVGPSVH